MDVIMMMDWPAVATGHVAREPNDSGSLAAPLE